MFTFVICVCLLSVATDVAHGRFVDLPQLPDGVTVHNVLQIWDEAVVNCQREGAILASPINENVFNAMKSLMNATRSTFYIGAKASQYPGRYVSLEGIPLENMTTAWYELDPSNGDCLAMTSEHLRVVPCGTRLPYMCIKPDIFNKNRNVTHISCDEEMRTVDGTQYLCVSVQMSRAIAVSTVSRYTSHKSTQHCYKLHGEEGTWFQALTTCFSEGGHLAVIDNAIEAEVITNMYDFYGSHYIFIGLQKTGDPYWKWIDGRPVESLFHVWNKGTIPNYASQACGALNGSWKLDDVGCDALLPFVCQKEPTV